MTRKSAQTFNLEELCDSGMYFDCKFLIMAALLHEEEGLRKRSRNLLKKALLPELDLLSGSVLDNQLYVQLKCTNEQDSFIGLFYVCDSPKEYEGEKPIPHPFKF